MSHRKQCKIRFPKCVRSRTLCLMCSCSYECLCVCACVCVCVRTLVLCAADLCSSTATFAKSSAILGNTEEHTSLSRVLSQLADVEEKIEQVHLQQVRCSVSLSIYLSIYLPLSLSLSLCVCLFWYISTRCAHLPSLVGVIQTLPRFCEKMLLYKAYNGVCASMSIPTGGE